MPCRDYEASQSRAYQANAEVAAMLCGVLTTIERSEQLDNLLNKIDYKEAGVSRSTLVKWWDDHKAKDEARRKQEAEEAQKKATRSAALKKLTAAERKALGL